MRTAPDGAPGSPLLSLRAQNDTLFRGIKPGEIGNYIVWLVEIAITFFIAHGRVVSATRQVHVGSVPGEVTDFVLHLMSDGRQIEDIRSELHSRGWAREEDADNALWAAAAVIAIVQESQED